MERPEVMISEAYHQAGQAADKLRGATDADTRAEAAAHAQIGIALALSGLAAAVLRTGPDSQS